MPHSGGSVRTVEGERGHGASPVLERAGCHRALLPEEGQTSLSYASDSRTACPNASPLSSIPEKGHAWDRMRGHAAAFRENQTEGGVDFELRVSPCRNRPERSDRNGRHRSSDRMRPSAGLLPLRIARPRL